jgi:7,8-dihydropterin-6-yl-methyl-4-(beta-D-ribofuranosyl)aminobenzene 5'-phosphate synthase
MRSPIGFATLMVLLCPLSITAADNAATSGRVKALKITVLSTMLADLGAGEQHAGLLGEWGFAALVEADGHRILFDTGAHQDVVFRNAAALKIDLATVPDVVLSHSHWDHVGGFLALRKSVADQNAAGLGRTHVAEGMFTPRTVANTAVPANPVLLMKPDYESSGGRFVVHPRAVQLYPGVWLTGPVPRKYPERNWGAGVQLVTPNGKIEDNVPEDMSLVCDTEQGLVVVTGCGHAGTINILEHARTVVRSVPVHALIGGLHLFNAKDETLAWTAGKLREFGVQHLLGAHCTGVETLYRFRHDLALDRTHAVVAAVGASFELDRGIAPGLIAK